MSNLSMSQVQGTLDKYFKNLVAPLDQPASDKAGGILVGVTFLQDGEWKRVYCIYGHVALVNSDRSSAAGVEARDIVVFIGSNTKVFTATQLALAQVNNLLTLNTAVSSLLPSTVSMQQPLGEIQLWHLATHSAGYPMDVCGAHVFGQYPFTAMGDFLNRFSPLYEPGKFWWYSNQGFALLGVLLAHAANSSAPSTTWDSSYQSWPALVTSQLLVPLGMPQTQVDYSSVRASLAQGYVFQGVDQPLKPVPPPSWDLQSAGLSAGALSSTLTDMLTFLEAQMQTPNSTSLSQAIALTQNPGFDEAALFMGLGWQVGNGYFDKNGGILGFESYMAFDPTQGIGIFAAANTSPGTGGGQIGDTLDSAARQALGALRGSSATPTTFPTPPRAQRPACPT